MHRHAVLFGQYNRSAIRHTQLSNVGRKPVSEAATLGFESGASLYSLAAMVLWEAQFGYYANVAQASNQLQQVWPSVLLPHGQDGAFASDDKALATVPHAASDTAGAAPGAPACCGAV